MYVAKISRTILKQNGLPVLFKSQQHAYGYLAELLKSDSIVGQQAKDALFKSNGWRVCPATESQVRRGIKA